MGQLWTQGWDLYTTEKGSSDVYPKINYDTTIVYTKSPKIVEEHPNVIAELPKVIEEQPTPVILKRKIEWRD